MNASRWSKCKQLAAGCPIDAGPIHAGKNLQAQYERWQPRAKYKMHLDPTTDDIKKLAVSCRRTAKVSPLRCRLAQ